MDTITPNYLEADLDRFLSEAVVNAGHPAGGPGKPYSNLLETWDSYYLQIALPGVDAGSLDIEVVARHARVRGSYRPPVIETATSIWHDIATGEFEEVFALPAEVDAGEAKAQYERGILTIKLPKAAYLKPSSVPVQVLS